MTCFCVSPCSMNRKTPWLLASSALFPLVACCLASGCGGDDSYFEPGSTATDASVSDASRDGGALSDAASDAEGRDASDGGDAASVLDASDADAGDAAAAAPTVTAVSPLAGPLAGGTTITVTGTGFTGATALSFGTQAGTSVTVVSSTQITVKNPAALPAAVDVTVTTPIGTSATSAADTFTYEAGPTIASIAPTSGSTAGGTTVTIAGSNFAGATSVTFDGTAATITSASASQIAVTSPVHTAAGAVNVVVTTPGGATTSVAGFTYVAPPTLASIAPVTGSINGGTLVTLTGTGFVPGNTTVTFGGVTATNGINILTTSWSVLAPAHAAGTVDVVVTTPAGSATLTNAYTYK